MNMHPGADGPFMDRLVRAFVSGLLATVGRVGCAVTVIIALGAL